MEVKIINSGSSISDEIKKIDSKVNIKKIALILVVVLGFMFLSYSVFEHFNSGKIDKLENKNKELQTKITIQENQLSTEKDNSKKMETEATAMKAVIEYQKNNSQTIIHNYNQIRETQKNLNLTQEVNLLKNNLNKY